jgi:oligopeptide transport system ATP-binding protein
MRTLTRESGTAMILITHDLGVVAATAQRVNVMYAGRIVESGAVADLFARPRHPYTVGLLRSIARPDRDAAGTLAAIPGQPPDPTALPSGCPFTPRCAWRLDRCAAEEPQLAADPSRADQRFACHNPVTPSEAEAGRPLRAAPAGAGA